MPLVVGRLVAQLDVDDSGFSKGMSSARADYRATGKSAAEMAQAVEKAGAKVQSARAAQNAAAVRVQAAERTLSNLRAAGETDAIKLARAETAVQTARASQNAATVRAAEATRGLAGAQRAQAASNAAAAASAGKATTATNGLATAAGRARDALAGIGLGVGLMGVVAGIRTAVMAASDLEESANKIEQLFGSNVGQIESWAASAAKSMALTNVEARDAAASMALYGKQANLSGQNLVGFSTQMTQLAADMASFSNTSPQDAVEALGAAFRGESDPIEKYGVLLNEARLKEEAMSAGLIKSTSEALSPAIRVQAVYNSVLKQTTAQQGDFARTGDSFSNKMKTLRADAINMAAAFGEKLLPVASAFVDVLTGVSSVVGAAGSAFSSLPGPIQAAIAALVAFRVASHFMGDKVTAATSKIGEAFRGLGVQSTIMTTQGQVAMGRFGTAVSGIGRHIPIVQRMQTSFVNAAIEARRFPAAAGAMAAGMTGLKGAASGLMGALGGPWGLAIAGATTALTIWMGEKQKDAAASEAAKAAQQEWADVLRDSGGAVTSKIRELAALKLEQQDLIDLARDAGIAERDLVTAVTGTAGQYDAAREKIEAYANKLAETSDNEMVSAAIKQDLMGRIDGVRAAYEGGQSSAMNLAKANNDVEVSFDGSKSAAGAMSEMMTEFSESTDGAASKVEKLARSLSGLQDDQLTQEEALQAWSDNLRDLVEALGAGGAAMVKMDGSIDVATEKGSQLQDTVVSQRDAYNQTAAAALEYARSQKMGPGEALDYVNGKLAPLRQKLIDTAIAAGVNADAAKKMADRYLGIPGEITTKLDLKGADAAIAKLNEIGVMGARTIEGKYQMMDNTAELRLRLDQMKMAYSVIDGKIIISDTDIKRAKGALEELGVKTKSLPDGFVKITDTSDENMARLERLGIEVQQLPDGTIVINPDDAEFWRRVQAAEKTGKKTIVIQGQIDSSSFRVPQIGGTASGVVNANGSVTEYKSGGIRPAGVPSMPEQAVIEKGRGAGLVRWAEGETGWESYIPGALSKRRRSTAILSETARRFGFQLWPANAPIRPYADGAVTGGYGLPAGGGGDFPDWVRAVETAFGVKASTYAGHQTSDRGESGYAPNPQGLNRGIDWTGSVDQMQAFADYLMQIAPSRPGLEQVIWQNPNTGQRAGWAGRQNVTDSGYYDSDYGGHQNHVHTRQSSDWYSGSSDAGVGQQAIADVTLTADSSREDVARKIIAEGRRRGYSDDEIQAVLATAIQESNLSPGASGGGGAWHGIFQQDDSYPGRDDPNTNITGFYDRLDEKRQADPGADIYDSIFWLQQRPGETSAANAVANGRSGYMDEIRSKDDEAAAMFDSLGPSVGYGTSSDGLGGSGSATPVFVTNWPSGGSSYSAPDSGDATSSPSTTTPVGTGKGRPRIVFRDGSGKSLMQRMQTGGTVPGTGLGDKIPLLAEPGEEIIRRSVAEQPGMRAFLKRINSGQPPIGKVRALPRFQNGGTVGFGGYADDDTDYMKPTGWQDMLALGVGGAFAVADLVQPYLAMAQSGNIDLGSLSPQLNTGSNSADLGIPQMVGELAGDIQEQLREVIRLLAEGKQITVRVEQDKSDSAANMVSMAARV